MSEVIEKQIEKLVGEQFKVSNYNLIRNRLEDLMDKKASQVFSKGKETNEEVQEYEDLAVLYTYLLDRYNQFLDIKESFLKN
jgi:6-phosphogluconolactonase/glucosamine-6-phosphate isomerase/deaminase